MKAKAKIVVKELIVPNAGTKWKDRKHPNRKLAITEVNPHSHNGRNVVGLISWTDGLSGSYACSLEVFNDVWEIDA